MNTKTFFVSDTHFGHKNIIRYCDRPFSSVTEMDKSLIRYWNQVVKPEDTVFHLGDFALANREHIENIASRLNGKIRLILGNHDKEQNFVNTKIVIERSPIMTIKVQDESSPNDHLRGLVMCHYAMRTWPHQHHGYWHIYGHSHGSLPDDPASMSLDIGIDNDLYCLNSEELTKRFCPISYEEIQLNMWKKKHWTTRLGTW